MAKEGNTAVLSQKAARVLDELEGFFEADGRFTKLDERVKALGELIEPLKKLDPKEIAEKFDRWKAEKELLIRAIRGSTRAYYVPGIEGEKFSVIKAILGCKFGFAAMKAEHEEEILKAVREKAAHVIGDDSKGGYFIPDQVIPEVIAAIYSKSIFMDLSGEDGLGTRVSVLEGLTGGTVTIPKFEGGMLAYWIGEEDDYIESLTSVGDVTMNPKKLGVLMRITDSMRKLQGFGFEALVRRDMVRAAAKKFDWTILYGKGTDHQPRGILNHAGIKAYRAENGTIYQNLADARAAVDWDGGVLNFDKMEFMRLALTENDIDLDSSAFWASSARFFTRLRQLKWLPFSGADPATQQLPYVLGAPLLSDAQLSAVIGPWDYSNQIPTTNLPGASIGAPPKAGATAKFTDVVTGNFSECVVGRWGGIEILDDAGQGRGFIRDHIYVKLRLYADILLRQERAFIACPDARTFD